MDLRRHARGQGFNARLGARPLSSRRMAPRGADIDRAEPELQVPFTCSRSGDQRHSRGRLCAQKRQ